MTDPFPREIRRALLIAGATVLTEEDAAVYCDCGKTTLEARRLAGEIDAVKVGKMYRYDRRELDRWLLGRDRKSDLDEQPEETATRRGRFGSPNKRRTI